MWVYVLTISLCCAGETVGAWILGLRSNNLSVQCRRDGWSVDPLFFLSFFWGYEVQALRPRNTPGGELVKLFLGHRWAARTVSCSSGDERRTMITSGKMNLKS